MMFLIYSMMAVVLLPRLRRTRTGLLPLLILTFFNTTLQSSLIFSGLNTLPASLSILTVQLQVPFAVVAASILGVEKPNIIRIAGVLTSFTGIALLTGIGSPGNANWGLVLVLLGAMSWGVGQALTRKYSRDDGLTFTAAIALAGAPQLLIATLLFEAGQLQSLITADREDWTALFIVGIGGFLLGYAIWFHQLRRFRVDQVTPFVLLMPLIGVGTSSILLGEVIDGAFILGGCIVMAGLVIIHSGDRVRQWRWRG